MLGFNAIVTIDFSCYRIILISYHFIKRRLTNSPFPLYSSSLFLKYKLRIFKVDQILYPKRFYQFIQLCTIIYVHTIAYAALFYSVIVLSDLKSHWFTRMDLTNPISISIRNLLPSFQEHVRKKKKRKRKFLFIKASQQYLVVYTATRCYTMREITCSPSVRRIVQ